MLALGQTIERYTVEAVVGQGGMAVVYRVRHNQLGSLHALKILTVPRRRIRDRLLQEGRVQAGLRHANVVQVTDVLEINGSPALLMEYVDGPTLALWLERHRPTVAEAEALFRGICEGVGEAHHHGLVHRDLKPGNVLLSCTRTGFLPKVTDFGIAKHSLTEDDVATSSNAAMGTPAYMSPEQIRDAKNVDQRADVFSLGCVLYELACGARPFRGPDVLAIFNAIADGVYTHPLDLAPQLPERIVSAIDGCLIVDRDRRFQDCHEVLLALGGGRLPDGPVARVQTGWEEHRPPPPIAPPALPDLLSDATMPPTVRHFGPISRPPRSLDSVDTLSIVDPNANTVPTAVRRLHAPPRARAPGPSVGSWVVAAIVGALIGVAVLAAGLYTFRVLTGEADPMTPVLQSLPVP